MTVEPIADQSDIVKIEELDREECFRLLATRAIGQLAVAEPGKGPYVVPVNFTLLRDSVVFRTDRGTKLRLPTRRRPRGSPRSSRPSGDPRLGAAAAVRQVDCCRE